MPGLHKWDFRSLADIGRWARWRSAVACWETGSSHKALGPRERHRASGTQLGQVVKVYGFPLIKHPTNRLRLLGRTKRSRRLRFNAACMEWCGYFTKHGTRAERN